jgi:membrane-bound lytic murein transglycosylase B
VASRIERGRELLAQHRPLLEEIGAAYGVQPRFIVALWGIETNFGTYTGGFPVIQALATLAHDGRRSSYFREELLNALQILDDGHIDVARMQGSWAGAMGQSQFMPSSFLRFAQDYDGDGRRDIWTTEADVFASAASYLAGFGWDADQTWGRQVRLPAGFDAGLADLEIRKPLSEWQRLGVRRADGQNLPAGDLTASLVLPDGPGGPAFLVYDNYRTIMRWNRSTYFATTVGILADRIGGCTDGPDGIGCTS